MKNTISLLKSNLTPLVLIVILLALFPVIGIPRKWLLYIMLFLMYLPMANMWNLLAGYSGLISLCQPAFIGLAGYTLAIVTWLGAPFYTGLLAGAIVAGVFAIIISIPVFRLSGIYFAIGTLVIPEALRIIFFLWRPVGSEIHGRGAGYMIKGISGVSMSEIYWYALVIGTASVILMHLILRSKLGLGLSAIRDNDRTAASSGIDVFRTKLYTFIISAIITGLAGGLFYVYQGYIEPASAFNIRWTMILLLATVIGGIRSQTGPIIGSAIVVVLHFLLAKYASISLLIQGVILVGIMLLTPQGIMGYISKTRPYNYLYMRITGNKPA